MSGLVCYFAEGTQFFDKWVTANAIIVSVFFFFLIDVVINYFLVPG